jgi:hypothetical protein
MELIADRAETYTLSEVRRFREGWEGPASLKLREGDADALREYDRRGRLVEAITIDDAIAAAARAAAADRIAGRSVTVTADTNETAAKIANAVREHLVAARVVRGRGCHLPNRIGGRDRRRDPDPADRPGSRRAQRQPVPGDRHRGEDGSLSVRGRGRHRAGAARGVRRGACPARLRLDRARRAGQTVDVGYFVDRRPHQRRGAVRGADSRTGAEHGVRGAGAGGGQRARARERAGQRPPG